MGKIVTSTSLLWQHKTQLNLYFISFESFNKLLILTHPGLPQSQEN